MICSGGKTHMKNLFKGQNVSAYPLRQALFNEYGSPDRRYKYIAKIPRYRVDACQSAKGVDGNPLSSVCTIWATVESESQLKLDLRGSIPLDGSVKEWFDSVGKIAVIGQNSSLGIKTCSLVSQRLCVRAPLQGCHTRMHRMDRAPAK
jgi:hypothetical protein